LIGIIAFLYLIPKKKISLLHKHAPSREAQKTELKPVSEQPKEIKTDIPHISAEKTTDVFEALRAYISARLRQGYGKEHIKETLILRGWPEEVVDVALDGSSELEDKLDEVEEYIRNSFAAGYKLKQIKSALMEQGWSEGIADLLLFEVHRPSKNMKNLGEYIDYKIMQGKNMSEIKQILRTVGWSEEVIDSMLR
jgi:hypothetical protein